MADITAQADVERASGTRLSDQAGHSPQPDEQRHTRISKRNVTADKVIVLSFRNLQLKRIGALQDELLELAVAGEPLPTNHDRLVDEALRNYAQALRDYETLSVNAVSTIPIGACLVGRMEFAGEEQREGIAERVARLILKILPGLEVFESFLAITPAASITINALRLILDAPSTDVGPSTAIRVIENICGKLGFRELDQQGRLRRAERKALTQRILMGLFGGIALICPVLVMVLYASRNTNLITVSVATIHFASLLAIGASDSTGKDVLAATAAYTAVLVVFFGTNGSSA